MTELIPMEENDGQQQEQDVAEREERLREILLAVRYSAVVFQRGYSAEDIDFIATCCGVADYRKPKT